MSTFRIAASFKNSSAGTLEDATRADIHMSLGATNITEFSDVEDRRTVYDHLDIPAYFLAEWIAENWWSLLYEPRKSDDDEEDGPDFISRHSFLSAQQGYALPNVKLVSNGRRAIYVTSFARNVPFADIRFLKTASLMLQPEVVISELKAFVTDTVNALEQRGITGTDLQDAWQAVQETDADEEPYCRMVGALGLSPYAEHDKLDELLFKLAENTSERLAMDLCLVAKPEEIGNYVNWALRARDASESAAESDLSPLLGIQVPADHLQMPAWKRGVQAADLVRARLGLSEKDPSGGSRFFAAMGMTFGGTAASKGELELVAREEGMPIVGSVKRVDGTAKIGLLQTSAKGRRFAAARGAFAAWMAGPSESRLLTQAVTRDQQSSRAFAAEVLAPVAFIRNEARKGVLYSDQIVDLADELGVSPGLVRKQAQNNGLTVRLH